VDKEDTQAKYTGPWEHRSMMAKCPGTETAREYKGEKRGPSATPAHNKEKNFRECPTGRGSYGSVLKGDLNIKNASRGGKAEPPKSQRGEAGCASADETLKVKTDASGDEGRAAGARGFDNTAWKIRVAEQAAENEGRGGKVCLGAEAEC